MNTFLFFSSLIAFSRASTIAVAPAAAATVAVAPAAVASTLVRAPAHDSASIESHRLGGNFAYSTAEAHAFAEVKPIISTITHPISETTHTHIPAAIATHQPAPIVRSHHVAQPIFTNVPLTKQVPVSGPVRTIKTVSQPITHETRTHSVQAVNTAYAQTHAIHGVDHVASVAHVAEPAVVGYQAHEVAPATTHLAHTGFAHAGYAAAAPIATAAHY
jgi:hypothetical protein